MEDHVLEAVREQIVSKIRILHNCYGLNLSEIARYCDFAPCTISLLSSGRYVAKLKSENANKLLKALEALQGEHDSKISTLPGVENI